MLYSSPGRILNSTDTLWEVEARTNASPNKSLDPFPKLKYTVSGEQRTTKNAYKCMCKRTCTQEQPYQCVYIPREPWAHCFFRLKSKMQVFRHQLRAENLRKPGAKISNQSLRIISPNQTPCSQRSSHFENTWLFFWATPKETKWIWFHCSPHVCVYLSVYAYSYTCVCMSVCLCVFPHVANMFAQWYSYE